MEFDSKSYLCYSVGNRHVLKCAIFLIVFSDLVRSPLSPVRPVCVPNVGRRLNIQGQEM